MVKEQKHTMGRTWVKLYGPLELVPVTEEENGGKYSITVRQEDHYYLGLGAIGDDMHEQWLLPTCAIYASPDARRACPVELDSEGVLQWKA